MSKHFCGPPKTQFKQYCNDGGSSSTRSNHVLPTQSLNENDSFCPRHFLSECFATRNLYKYIQFDSYQFICIHTKHTHTHSIKWNDYACLKSNAHCVISTPKYAAVPYYYSHKTKSYVRTHMSIQDVTHKTHIIMLTMHYYTSLFVRVLDFCELRVEFCISWHMVAVEAELAFRQTRKCFLQLNHRYYKIK